MRPIETLTLSSWSESPSIETQELAIDALENGKVVYIPNLAFEFAGHEKQFLSPDICDERAKNLSFDIRNDKLGGTHSVGNQSDALKALMKRYAMHSSQLLNNLFPQYAPHVKQARTSYRPVEIAGRKAASFRKDDTLLHVDAFPSSPVKGERILRVFTNVNPHDQARVWRVGEDLNAVVNKFAPKIKKPFPGSALLQYLLNITKDYRTVYDHYMLHIHHAMKADLDYQKNVAQHELKFPPGSTWFVYTDQVSHAAMSGQYVFEQTFHLPVHALKNKSSAPLLVLEKFFNQVLI